ncbi:FkbM family methyltransferase [Paracoccus sp. PARArs4]|uniref:FkbM family methyltransferase n=1 Tax=Paracoccus sp. PARArs4 TaxID=2853442 RepID=UPI0024A736EA|nr:FkbM family methyltransferase [Paracoccus sp. PARArs4]
MNFRAALGLMRSIAIYYNPVRVRQLRRHYAGIIRRGDLVIDVGAHVGSRSRAMRAAGARVVAVEPQEPFAGFLARSLPRDVTLIRKALGPAEAVASMAVSSLHPTVSSLSQGFTRDAADAPGFDHVRWDRRQQVQVTTLDQVIAQHGLPQFVKIDVEGFEEDVLAGLSQPVPMLSVEYLPAFRDRTLRVMARLAQLGDYRFNVVRGETGVFLWDDWRDAGQVGDWLATLPRDGGSGDLYARMVPAKS